MILDLDGLSRDAVDLTALKVISNILTTMQDLFPDVLRKAFIIRAPGFIHMSWALISPCLAKQTQQKIEFCGADWRERLKVSSNLTFSILLVRFSMVFHV